MTSSASALCKVDFNGDIRRFQLTPASSFATLKSHLTSLYGIIDFSTVRVVYADQDGDLITINSNSDLVDALSISPNHSYRLSVLPAAELPSFAAPSPSCGQCRTVINTSETLFKCGHCANFSLCARCHSQQLHEPSHIFLLLTPDARMIHHHIPSDRALLPASFGPSSSSPSAARAAAAPQLDLGSIFQSVSDFAKQLSVPDSPSAQTNPLESLLAAFNGSGVPPELNSLISQFTSGRARPPVSPFRQPAPTPTPAATPDPSALREALRNMGVPEDQIELVMVASGGDPTTAMALLFENQD